MDDELLHLATAQTLDLLFAVLSLALFTLYHAWYYSWHWYPANGEPRFHRLDRTGQTARQLFTQAVLFTGSEPDFNLAVQIMSVTTLINVMLDSDKMDVVRQMSRKDPLTGGSSIITPEAKLGTAVAALFLSFFALAQACPHSTALLQWQQIACNENLPLCPYLQALRLFVHYPFLIRAAQYCRFTSEGTEVTSLSSMEAEAMKTCLRGQTFFSLGLRFLYCFIPIVMWTMGGTWLLVGSPGIVVCLYVLDQV
ncbi:hypothetical protein D9Q98_008892 [Chlorella vulgaris]|uniref:Uncharacterized protein n=1 Tax=Chlorella vulgaris TaxID=3077 RepID=A0A9D4TGV5_CHLVU|nr:hypothetical protein D9Q98_008892 [Chlorella vulgaris]